MDIPAITATDFSFPGQTGVYHGKVRDMYSIGKNTLVSVATDRISAFDSVLALPIPYKGQVLNELAAYFLQETASIVPNWLQGVPDPNASVGVRAEPIKVEVIMRGLLVGHAWREYQQGVRELCGVSLPDGMKEYDAFPRPILTPTTKADAGHDQDISEAEIIERGLASEYDWQQIADYAKKLFDCGQEMAGDRSLVLADTKYEFGKLSNGRIILIDEVHTPDSSRYFYAQSHSDYVSGRSDKAPEHLSKEFVRKWLLDQGYDGQGPAPIMGSDFVSQVSERYIELYEKMTGQTFIKATGDDPLIRMQANIKDYLKQNLQETSA